MGGKGFDLFIQVHVGILHAHQPHPHFLSLKSTPRRKKKMKYPHLYWPACSNNPRFKDQPLFEGCTRPRLGCSSRRKLRHPPQLLWSMRNILLASAACNKSFRLMPKLEIQHLLILNKFWSPLSLMDNDNSSLSPLFVLCTTESREKATTCWPFVAS